MFRNPRLIEKNSNFMFTIENCRVFQIKIILFTLNILFLLFPAPKMEYFLYVCVFRSHETLAVYLQRETKAKYFSQDYYS